MRTLILAFCMWSAAAFASLTFGPLSADTNATRTTVDVLWSLSGTNTTSPTVTLYWAAADAGTNAGAWSYSTNLGERAMATYTNRVGALTPSRPWYFRLSAVDATNTAWTTNYAYSMTLSGAPTSSPPGHAYVPIMVSTSGVIVAPANIQDFVTGSGTSLTNTAGAAAAAQATASAALGHRYQPAPMLGTTNGVVAWREMDVTDMTDGLPVVTTNAWPAGLQTNQIIAPDGLGSYTWAAANSLAGQTNPPGYHFQLTGGGDSTNVVVTTNGATWMAVEAEIPDWVQRTGPCTPWPPKPGQWSVDTNSVQRWAYKVDGYVGSVPAACIDGAVSNSSALGGIDAATVVAGSAAGATAVQPNGSVATATNALSVSGAAVSGAVAWATTAGTATQAIGLVSGAAITNAYLRGAVTSETAFIVSPGTVSTSATVRVRNGGQYANLDLIAHGVGYGNPTAVSVTSPGDKVLFLNVGTAKSGFGAGGGNDIWVQSSAALGNAAFRVYNGTNGVTPTEVFRVSGNGAVACSNNLTVGGTISVAGGTLTTNVITGDGKTNTIIHRSGVIQSWTVTP